MNEIELTVKNLPEPMRLDRYLAEVAGILTRSQLKQREPHVLIDGKKVKLSRKVHDGMNIMIRYEDVPEPTFVPEQIPLNILYEDQDTLVLNKPQGMVVHPGAGNYSGTLVQGILYYCKEMIDKFDLTTMRPGIVHRLDKDTSGVIVAAKNPAKTEELSTLFKSRKTRKIYLALVKGSLKQKKGKIESCLCRDPKNRKRFIAHEDQGKHALTFYKVLREWGDYSLVMVRIMTGRTHQIRVHLKSLGNPILGDPVYGKTVKEFPNATLMLHAFKLSLRLSKGEAVSTFRAPLPVHFVKMLKVLDRRYGVKQL